MMLALGALLAVAMLALLAAACDGDDGDGDTPAVGEKPVAGDGGGDEALAALGALAGEATEGFVAKVTYRVSGQVDGESIGGEWVLVQRPPDSRFEISLVEEGEELRTIIISAGGETYLCIAGGGEESCLTTGVEEAEALTVPFDPIFDIPRELAEDIAGVDLVDTSQREIAGVDATCFTVSGSLIDLGEGEVCFSDGGILLLLSSESDGETFTFEATSVSTDVTDADFEPPFDVIDLPGFQ